MPGVALPEGPRDGLADGVCVLAQVPIMRRIAAEEGWQALWRGVRPRVLFNAPAAAISWGTYESVKGYLSGSSGSGGGSGGTGGTKGGGAAVASSVSEGRRGGGTDAGPGGRAGQASAKDAGERSLLLLLQLLLHTAHWSLSRSAGERSVGACSVHA